MLFIQFIYNLFNYFIIFGRINYEYGIYLNYYLEDESNLKRLWARYASNAIETVSVNVYNIWISDTKYNNGIGKYPYSTNSKIVWSATIIHTAKTR